VGLSPGCPPLSVAQHRAFVAILDDFFQPVGNVDNGDPWAWARGSQTAIGVLRSQRAVGSSGSGSAAKDRALAISINCCCAGQSHLLVDVDELDAEFEYLAGALPDRRRRS
jgi:hypothetical protein